jgi:general secretion pathway protein C
MIIAPMHSLPRPSGANPWLIRLLTLMLAALAAGSSLYWVLKWPANGSVARQPTLNTNMPPIDSDKIALLLGASQATVPAAVVNVQTNFKLLGVITQGAAGSRGSALIATDGQPAKPYRVGDLVADGLVLHSVKARAAYLASDAQAAPVSIELELPALK